MLSTLTRKARNFLRTLRLYKNWPRFVLFRLRLARRVTLRLRTGEAFAIRSQEDLAALKASEAFNRLALEIECGPVNVEPEAIAIQVGGRALRFSCGPQIADCVAILREQFVDEQYGWLRVRGCRVLDIGGAMGDSAIYFALRGASHVHVFEPFPQMFKLLRANVEHSGFAGKITPVHAGAGRDGATRLPGDTLSTNLALAESQEGEEVLTYSFASLLRITGLRHSKDGVAKIDCEGGEYPLLLDAEDRDLRILRQYMIEYHNDPRELVSKLARAGFKVRHTRPIPYTNLQGEVRDIGLIEAERQGDVAARWP